MDPAKVEFLFDRVPEGTDLDDADNIGELLTLQGDDPATDARSAIRTIVAEQILGENPPAVWATAQRLMALGLDRADAMAQLAVAFAQTAQTPLAGDGGSFDSEAYETALASLPLPPPADIET